MKALYQSDFALYEWVRIRRLSSQPAGEFIANVAPSSVGWTTVLQPSRFFSQVCKELNIKCVRFAIPNNPDVPSQAISPVAVDGNYVQWLVRQKLFKWKHRPKPVRRASRLIGFKRHPIEPVPEGHGEPQPVKQKVSWARISKFRVFQFWILSWIFSSSKVPNSLETFGGSFSAVSTPTSAKKCSLESS